MKRLTLKALAKQNARPVAHATEGENCSGFDCATAQQPLLTVRDQPPQSPICLCKEGGSPIATVRASAEE